MSDDKIMDQSLRLRFFRRRRPTSIDEISSQVWELLDALAALHPAWKQWSTRDAGFQPHRVRSAAECARYLTGAEMELLPGNRPSHRLIFSSAGSREQSCDLRVLFALEGAPARWTLGLRLEMRIGASVHALEAGGARLIQEVTLAAIRAFHPLVGFAGTMVSPDPRWDESREPEAGWITYISRAANAESYRGQSFDPDGPPEPAAVPPAVVSPVLDLGWLIVAFPEIMTPGDDGQLAKLGAARRALGPRVRQEVLESVTMSPDVVVPGRPAYAALPASSDGASPWARRAKGGLAGTSLSVEVPRGLPLPFAPAGTPSEALARAVKEAIQVQGPKRASPDASLAATAALVDLGAILQALPFAKGAPAGSDLSASAALSGPPKLTLEQHASLCVEIAQSPARTIETLARYRITSQEKVVLDQHYRDRIAADPEVRATWERSYQSYHVWLQSNQARGR